MRQWLGIPVAGALLLSACVTINVYFPAAEAKEAAREFVEKVIDQADKVEVRPAPAGGGGMAMLGRRFDFDPWMLVGIGCRLANAVCRMAGLQHSQQSQGQGAFTIVEGAGLPRLDVVGYNRSVDWPTLVERLQAVGSGEVAPVVE